MWYVKFFLPKNTFYVRNFINSLIQHIPPEQFKIIRYYGIYSRNQRNK
ncbi:transposase [Candidatus Woesearchaeota archaeon]|nr:transposase [Candidatus Woesearchaeota archaeon]